MKFKKSIATLGLAAALIGAVTPASAASFHGISVTPTTQYGVDSNNVKFAIKDDNTWVVASDVTVQQLQADKTWKDVGLGAQVVLNPEEKQYITVGQDFFPSEGQYRYKTHTVKVDTGYDVGTFYSEQFTVYVYTPPAPTSDTSSTTSDGTMTPEQIKEMEQAAGEARDAEYQQTYEQGQIDAIGSNWDAISQERYEDSKGG